MTFFTTLFKKTLDPPLCDTFHIFSRRSREIQHARGICKTIPSFLPISRSMMEPTAGAARQCGSPCLIRTIDATADHWEGGLPPIRANSALSLQSCAVPTGLCRASFVLIPRHCNPGYWCPVPPGRPQWCKHRPLPPATVPEGWFHPLARDAIPGFSTRSPSPRRKFKGQALLRPVAERLTTSFEICLSILPPIDTAVKKSAWTRFGKDDETHLQECWTGLCIIQAKLARMGLLLQ